MNSRFKIFYSGLFISLAGAIPLGVLNVTASHISANKGTGEALAFAIGVLLVEVFYVRVTLTGLNLLKRKEKLFARIHTSATWLMAGMGVVILFSVSHPSVPAFVQQHPPAFLLGLLLSAVNLAQIPFWLGWNAVLMRKKILPSSTGAFNVYVTGVGTGTLAGLSLFIWGGREAATILQQHQNLIDVVIGFTFFFPMAQHLYRRKKIFVMLVPSSKG